MTQNDGAARVSLRPLGPDDQDEFIAQARASAGLHHPWFTMPTTPADFQTYLARFSRATTEGFLVCLREDGTMAGMITIDSIIRGRYQSASVSYAAFAPAAGYAPAIAVHRRRLAGPRAVGHHPPAEAGGPVGVSRRRRCRDPGPRRCRR